MFNVEAFHMHNVLDIGMLDVPISLLNILLTAAHSQPVTLRNLTLCHHSCKNHLSASSGVV